MSSDFVKHSWRTKSPPVENQCSKGQIGPFVAPRNYSSPPATTWFYAQRRNGQLWFRSNATHFQPGQWILSEVNDSPPSLYLSASPGLLPYIPLQGSSKYAWIHNAFSSSLQIFIYWFHFIKICRHYFYSIIIPLLWCLKIQIIKNETINMIM